MKLYIISTIIFLNLVPFSLLAIFKQCECGSHATGIVAYTVDGETCCESAKVGSGSVHNYQQNNGIWEYVNTDFIAGNSAQNRCCKNS